MKIYDTNKAIVYSEAGIKLLCNRQLKTIIAPKSSKNFIGQDIAICNEDKVYGIITLNEPMIIDDDIFKNHFSRHAITEDFRESVWPTIKKFYSFTFRIKKIFKEPIAYQYASQELTMSSFLEDVKILYPEVIAAEKLQKKVDGYKDKLEVFKNKECNSNNELLKNLFMEVYQLYIKKMEIDNG